MLSKHITFALCAGLLGLSACAHDSKSPKQTTASAAAQKEPARDMPVQAATSGTSADADACELAVYFDTDSARLDQASQQRLDKVAECMRRREVDHATIVGQTDPTGTAEHNQQLGLERARVVAEYLRGRGVPDEQIRVHSKGELAAAESEELWPVERRAGVDVKK